MEQPISHAISASRLPLEGLMPPEYTQNPTPFTWQPPQERPLVESNPQLRWNPYHDDPYHPDPYAPR
jgi:hypothetical protein